MNFFHSDLYNQNQSEENYSYQPIFLKGDDDVDKYFNFTQDGLTGSPCHQTDYSIIERNNCANNFTDNNTQIINYNQNDMNKPGISTQNNQDNQDNQNTVQNQQQTKRDQKPKQPFDNKNVFKQIIQDLSDELSNCLTYLKLLMINQYEQNREKRDYYSKVTDYLINLYKQQYPNQNQDDQKCQADCYESLYTLYKKFLDFLEKKPSFLSFNIFVYENEQGLNEYQLSAFKYLFKLQIEEVSISQIFEKKRRVNAEDYLFYVPQFIQLLRGEGNKMTKYSKRKQSYCNKTQNQKTKKKIQKKK